MMALVVCLLIQPQNDLFAKLDALHAQQLKKLTEQLASAQKKKQIDQVESLKQELTSLRKNYAITIPLFDFSSGVNVGDLGTIGYYIEHVTTPVNRGDGKIIRIGVPTKLVRSGKIQSIHDDYASIRFLPINSEAASEVVHVSGLPKSSLIEEKIIDLNGYIYEYKGKVGSGVKQYQIIGNQADFIAWRAARLKK